MVQKRVQSKYGLNEPGQPQRNAIVVEYDFAADGGATGDIVCRGDTLPSGAVIVDVLLDVLTVFTSAGAATVAVKAESAADINAADAITGAPWSTTGKKRADFTATTAPVVTTADRAVTLTVATAALTAGKCRIITEYYLPA